MELDNKNYPLVSVIMGIYNCADTLVTAVGCIQNQTYENWELILCDDCSHDNTYETACQIAASDKRIKVIRNETNLTLAPTLNKCLTIARGKYIARMDGDDTCSLDRIEREVELLEGHPEFAIVSCNMSLSNEHGVFRVISYKEKPEIKDFIFGNQHCHAGCMVCTEAIKNVGGYNESQKFKRVEDYDLWIRMYRAGYRGYNLQETLYDMFDSETALRRRSLANRLNESRVIREACRSSKANIFLYSRALLPIVKWAMPTGVYRLIHIRKSKQKE